MNDKKKQGSYDALIQIALDSVRAYQNASAEERTRLATHDYPFPSSVPVGESGSALITNKGYSALRRIGRRWHDNNPTAKKVMSRMAAEDLAVRAFGDLLASDQPPTKSILMNFLEARAQSQAWSGHYYFPARIFDQEGVQSFQIGPVTFYQRADWLDAVERVSGAVSEWKAQVLNRWTKNQNILNAFDDWFSREVVRRWPRSWAAKMVRARLMKSMYVDDVVKEIGPCEWVIAVAVDGRGPGRSPECAAIAASVALDSLGLLMPANAAKNLRGPDDERSIKFHRDLHQANGEQLAFSTTLNAPRLGGSPGAQAELLSNSAILRNAAGRALTAFVDIGRAANASIFWRWVEAMYWFGQARRERSEFIALVKYGIALDVLAKGTGEGGILTLLCALLGKSEGELITSEDRTLKQVVSVIYKEGRSQVVHGGLLALLRELPIELSIADTLTARALEGYVLCAAEHSGPDTYEDFLVAVPALRTGVLAAVERERKGRTSSAAKV
jgi:hypothetical protein